MQEDMVNTKYENADQESAKQTALLCKKMSHVYTVSHGVKKLNKQRAKKQKMRQIRHLDISLVRDKHTPPPFLLPFHPKSADPHFDSVVRSDQLLSLIHI